METNLISKATFSEVYDFLKEKPDSDIFQCFKSLFGVALLFFPALISQGIAGIIVGDNIIIDVATGATLAGAGIGTIVSKASKDAFSLFKNRDHGDYVTRYNQIQIAQVMMVFASYFDTISQCLPDENEEITLSPDAKQKISHDGFQEYIRKIVEPAKQQNGMHKLMDKEFNLPNPTQGFLLYKDELKNFYMALNNEFIKFFESISFWEEISKEENIIDRAQKEYFSKLLRKLPEMAVLTYENQYFELSKDFPEFAVWANHVEHTLLNGQIDIGFKRIAEELKKIYSCVKNVKSEVFDTLEHYHTKYVNYISEPIIMDENDDFEGGIMFPSKKDIFIPQAFQALTYQKSMQLEQDDTWEKALSGEKIDQYISNILRHPNYGDTPMLILGLPGAGKTLLCHMLAAQVLSSEYHVIIIKLRDAIAENTIMKQIDAQIENDFGDNCSWNDLRKVTLDKPLVLIFDGYDELLQASGKTYSNYINKIADFQAEQKSIYHVFVRCIITSRVTLIDKAFIPDNCHILRLCDFDSGHINAWTGIWNQSNKQYFEEHNLKELEIVSSGKIKELAGQPLLLLMLALYDMNENCLHKQRDISRTELYYKLIYNFVRREKRKDSDFNQLPASRQENAIQNGFYDLGVVALGMYNRKKLYIRTKELNKDIAFLKQRSDLEDGNDENELEEADKQIAGFFFVYSSKSTVQNNGNYTQIAAYEFLHNTFGEFLTAYYILNIVFRIVKRQIKDIDYDEEFSWPEKIKREWFISLAYAQLFTRPVILNMLHELSMIIAKENSLEALKVQDALDSLICEEIKNIIAGDTFSELNVILNMQGNPFKHSELMMHVAAYSINLILLRLVVCSERFSFTEKLGSEDDWQKLTHIWRYAFSEEELVGLSCLISLEKSDKGYNLAYSVDEEVAKQASSFSKMDRLREISNVLGEDAAYAIYGSFDVPINEEISFILKKEKLNLETQYALSAVVRCLMNPDMDQEKLIYLLHGLLQCCEKERNAFGLYVYCSLLYSLNDMCMLNGYDFKYLLNRNIFHVIDMVLEDVEFDAKWFYLRTVLQDILSCVYNLKQEKIEFIHEFVEFYSYEIRRTSFHAEKFIAKNILNIFHHFFNVLQVAVEKKIAENVGRISYDFLRETKNFYKIFSWKEMETVMSLCQTLRKYGENEYSNKIFSYSIYQISEKGCNMMWEKCSSLCLSSMIECYYFMLREQRSKRDNYYCRSFFEQYLGKLDIVNMMLPLYEENFSKLFLILCNDIDLSRQWDNWRSKIDYALEEYGSQLSVDTLKRIEYYGKTLSDMNISYKAVKVISQK